MDEFPLAAFCLTIQIAIIYVLWRVRLIDGGNLTMNDIDVIPSELRFERIVVAVTVESKFRGMLLLKSGLLTLPTLSLTSRRMKISRSCMVDT